MTKEMHDYVEEIAVHFLNGSKKHFIRVPDGETRASFQRRLRLAAKKQDKFWFVGQDVYDDYVVVRERSKV